MQRKVGKAVTIALLTLGTVSLIGCEDEGPAEQMGERLDDALSEAQDRLEDARDEVEDAAEEVGDALRGE